MEASLSAISATRVDASARHERAMAAHDLRSALQGVIGGISMLDTPELAPAQREQCRRVAAAADNVARMVDVLLGEPSAPDRSVELAALFDLLSRRWSGEARERGLRLRAGIAPDVCGTIGADFTSLARALGNLISNATRHAGKGDVELLALRTPDGGAELRVLDNGPGLSQDAIDRALRPGRGPARTDGYGHGLGLHIVRSLCAEMGGTFGLSNRPAGGLQASLAFPAEICFPATGAPQPSPETDLSRLRILLAEDNPTNQIVAVQMLRALNAQVTLCADGVEALERFESEEFDLIVVDIEMPRMTGLDVIRAIRARSDGREGAPIVALTAYAMREHRERIAAAGANGLISKPILDVASLGAALRAHVDPARLLPDRVEPAARPDDAPIADLEVYEALCATIGADMMAELLDKVVADLGMARRDMADALPALERKSIRAASHILISVAGAIGATRLQSCARNVNFIAHGDEDEVLAPEVRRCIAEIDAAVRFARSKRAEA